MTSDSTILPLEGRLPELVAFDLDYTLWDLWVDTHVTPPLKRRSPTSSNLNLIYDKYSTPLSFYPEVPSILLQLHHSRVHVAAASRTSAPKVARQALTELLIPGTLREGEDEEVQRNENGNGNQKKGEVGPVVSAIKMFDTMEIYPGSKLTHFKEIHKKTKIPYSEMVFFDDEPRNMEVTKLGVTFVLVRDGVTKELFESGLDAWRKGLSDGSGN